MTTDMRTLLNRVASGELSPEDAQALLAGSPAPLPAPVAVTEVVIRASAVRLTVIADASVDTAVAEGPHRVEHDGARLIIHSDLSVGQYSADTPRSAFMNWINAGLRAGAALRVRVNPNLPLEVLNVAGSLDLSGHQAALAVGVEAGSAKIARGRGPLKLSVSTGSADVEWQFVGESSVSSEMGSVQVAVLPGSDVLITADSSAGSVQIRGPQGNQKIPGAGSATAVTVGAGTGRLSVSAKLSSASVRIL
ncbi:MAG: hypothetical protein PSX37_10955 [bacterium]|nr:hypothetical protein [bacterium]